MKTTKKVILLAVCALLLVVATVLGTLAYFTSEDNVLNTFTVGQISITLDEGKLSSDGKTIDKSAGRVKKNAYNVVPGRTYEKDPTLHVDASSENAWLFIELKNGISNIESDAPGDKNIAAQILDNGWTLLSGTSNVYYRLYNKDDSVYDYALFTKFTVDDDMKPSDLAKDAVIEINAYAIQLDGFEDNPSSAWANFAK